MNRTGQNGNDDATAERLRVAESVAAWIEATEAPPAERAEKLAGKIEGIAAAFDNEPALVHETTPETAALEEAARNFHDTPADDVRFEKLREALSTWRRGNDPAPPITNWRNVSEPVPVLWRDEDSGGCSAVCSVGEPAIFGAPGKSGKSYISLAVALEAAKALADKQPYGAACGLRVRPGPVLFANYEDRPARLWHRVRRIIEATGTPPETADRLHILDPIQPLYEQPEGRGKAEPGDGWERLWSAVRRHKPSLIVIDPASSALAGVNLNDSQPVREFMGALAAQSEATGCGVLIIAHDTKAARNEAAGGGNPGAGAISGSATWFDAARGVLYLYRDLTANHRLLVCMAANSGRDGWGFRLQERHRPGTKPGEETEQSFAGYMTGGDDGLTLLTPVEVDAELAKWRATAMGNAEKGKALPPGPGRFG